MATVRCPNCNAANAPEALFCQSCGTALTSPTVAAPAVAGLPLAEHGPRVIAFVIDWIIASVVSGIILTIFGGLSILPLATMGADQTSRQQADAAGAAAFGLICIGILLIVALNWLYSAYFESSPSQGTPGKMMMGLRVTDMNGQRITFGRASLRYIGKIISGSCFYIGYIIAFFTERRQGLHDMMASTLVVAKR